MCHSLGARLDDVNVFAAHRVADLDHRLSIGLVVHGGTAALHAQPVGHQIGQLRVRVAVHNDDISRCNAVHQETLLRSPAAAQPEKGVAERDKVSVAGQCFAL